ncbi:UNVERIFIED_CONTAM: hypothetical protein Sradi_3611800 [Sesamum radiatum]|uniref:Uncharacterized protein n=1 Tax=Sesamum radiatum TaxID=300843 RepID=A0AAW2QIG3_SESRA
MFIKYLHDYAAGERSGGIPPSSPLGRPQLQVGRKEKDRSLFVRGHSRRSCEKDKGKLAGYPPHRFFQAIVNTTSPSSFKEERRAPSRPS